MRVGVAQERGDVLLLAGIERARRRSVPPASSISATSGASLSPLRRPAKTVKPSAANFFAIAAPMKSPAPITAAVALRLVKGGPPEEPDGLMYNRLAGKPNQIGVAV